MPQIPLIQGDKVDANTDYRDALPVNMYAVPKDILGAKGYMINFYGLKKFAEGPGIDRGGVWVANADLEGHYRVSGTKLIELSQFGEVAEIGSIPGSDQVSFAYSFNNLAIVADGRLYYYNKTAGLRQIIDPEVGSPIDIVWVDGYFFLTNGEDIYHSNIANEELYEPLATSNAQFIPDSARGLSKTEANEVVVWGELSKEHYFNAATDNFAFQRISQKASKLGILGTKCKSEMNGRFYTIGRRDNTAPSFYILGLGQTEKIGSIETDKILSEYSDDELLNAKVETITDDGQGLILFRLPRHTILFNESIYKQYGASKAYSLLKTDVQGDRPLRCTNFVRDPRNGKFIVGDSIDGTIGELDRSICTHYDEVVEWILFTPLVKMETLSINELSMETIPGISPNNDATVFISMTYDARNYGKEWSEEYGLNNEYNERFTAYRLGYVRNWVGMKFRGASSSRMAFCYLNIEAS